MCGGGGEKENTNMLCELNNDVDDLSKAENKHLMEGFCATEESFGAL